MARRWRSKAGGVSSARTGRRRHAGSADDSGPGRIAADPDRGGGMDRLDPDAAAFALSLSVVLREAVDYRAAATLQQNTVLVDACGISYEAASGAAARAASRLRETGR